MCSSPHNGLVLVLLLAAPTATTAAEPAMRDPLRPPGYRETVRAEAPAFEADAWQLASTLVSQGRRVAIINGHSVRAGDTVAGAEVVSIDAGRAVLDYNGRRFTIRRATTKVRRQNDRREGTR